MEMIFLLLIIFFSNSSDIVKEELYGNVDKSCLPIIEANLKTRDITSRKTKVRKDEKVFYFITINGKQYQKNILTNELTQLEDYDKDAAKTDFLRAVKNNDFLIRTCKKLNNIGENYVFSHITNPIYKDIEILAENRLYINKSSGLIVKFELRKYTNNYLDKQPYVTVVTDYD